MFIHPVSKLTTTLHTKASPTSDLHILVLLACILLPTYRSHSPHRQVLIFNSFPTPSFLKALRILTPHMATAEVEVPPVDSPGLPDYLLDPNAVLKDSSANWRYGRAPDYSNTRKIYEQSEFRLLLNPTHLLRWPR